LRWCLFLRVLPFSLPAAIGFIALGGIAVLNGVVIATEVRKRLREGEAQADAIIGGFTSVVRAVLTTATVAALGFLPMALARGAGAEVQRPLATVVVVGMLFGTLLTLAVLPGVLTIALRGYKPQDGVAKERGSELADSGSKLGRSHEVSSPRPAST
jgi:cobalt-zinc-cadmium resistance protein CzcA